MFRVKYEPDNLTLLCKIHFQQLCRLLRVLKLNKYNSAFGIFFNTVIRSMPALAVLLFIMALCIILFGSILFLAEEGTWYMPSEDCGDGPGSCASYGDSGVYLREDVSRRFWAVFVSPN